MCLHACPVAVALLSQVLSCHGGSGACLSCHSGLPCPGGSGSCHRSCPVSLACPATGACPATVACPVVVAQVPVLWTVGPPPQALPRSKAVELEHHRLHVSTAPCWAGPVTQATLTAQHHVWQPYVCALITMCSCRTCVP